MQRLLLQLGPPDDPLRKEAMAAWGAFAGLGPKEALWAFEHYPGEPIDLARPCLRSAPEDTIRWLLQHAEAPRSQKPSQAQPWLRHAVDFLKNWFYEVAEETIQRRQQALRVARSYVGSTDSKDVLKFAFRLGCLTLRPTFSSDGIDPTRTSLIARSGPLPQALLKQMQEVWNDALRLFEITGVVCFPELFCEIVEWKRLAERAVDFPSAVMGMALRGELSTAVAAVVLAHPDPALALAMAFGEWMADPKGEVRPELEEPWRQAVLRSTELASPRRVELFQITELLSSDPELAYEWLLQISTKTACLDSEIRSTAGSALGFLGPERRQDLLERLSPGSAITESQPSPAG